MPPSPSSHWWACRYADMWPMGSAIVLTEVALCEEERLPVNCEFLQSHGAMTTMTNCLEGAPRSLDRARAFLGSVEQGTNTARVDSSVTLVKYPVIGQMWCCGSIVCGCGLQLLPIGWRILSLVIVCVKLYRWCSISARDLSQSAVASEAHCLSAEHIWKLIGGLICLILCICVPSINPWL